MEDVRLRHCDTSESQAIASSSLRSISGHLTYVKTRRRSSTGPTFSQSCCMDARHEPPLTLWKSISMHLTPVLVFAENFANSIHQAHYQRDSPEYHRELASLRWGEVPPPEVLWTPGSLKPCGRSPPCHRRCSKTTNRLEETCWTSTNHLAENN